MVIRACEFIGQSYGIIGLEKSASHCILELQTDNMENGQHRAVNLMKNTRHPAKQSACAIT